MLIDTFEPELVALAHVTEEADQDGRRYARHDPEKVAKDMAKDIYDNFLGYVAGTRPDFTARLVLDDEGHIKAASKVARHFRLDNQGRRPEPVATETSVVNHDGKELSQERHLELALSVGSVAVYVETTLIDNRRQYIDYHAATLPAPAAS